MEIVQRKNDIPFSDFYNNYYQKIVNYISKKIGNHHDAEDLAGEIFLYCYSRYEDYDPNKSTLSTWLYLIVNSRIKNYYRDAKTHVDLEAIVGVLPDDSVDMETCFYLQRLRQQLESAISKLSERQQKIVTMRYFEEYTNAQIAEILGMSQINVRVQLSRALDSLERLCGNLLEGDK